MTDSTSPPPRPGRVLTIASLADIACIAALLAVITVGFLQNPEWKRAVNSGVLAVALLATLGLQYWGVFRRGRRASELATFLQLGLCCFSIAIGVYFFFLFVSYSADSLLRTATLASQTALIAIGVLAGYTAYLDSQWVTRLKKYPHPLPPTQFTLRELMGFTATLAVFLAVVGAMRTGVNGYVLMPPKRYGEHMTAAETRLNLPAAASDVNFSLTASEYIFCEFTIEQAAFREWVEDELGYTLETKNFPRGVGAYGQGVPGYQGPNMIYVYSGLYAKREKDDDPFIVYDDKINRAYYSGPSF